MTPTPESPITMRPIDELIAAIKSAPLTGDGIDPFAAMRLLGEIERLRVENAKLRRVADAARERTDHDVSCDTFGVKTGVICDCGADKLRETLAALDGASEGGEVVG